MNQHTLVGSLVFVITLTCAAPVLAATDVPRPSKAMSIPSTVDEHEVLARIYEEQIARYRKDAQFHRDMLAALKENHSETVKAAQLAKMETHCTMLIKDAEKLAEDTQKAADYHHLRAKEMQGK